MSTTRDRRSGLPARLLLVALVGIGLVGMHHLVATACHHVESATTAVASSDPHGHDMGADPSAPVAPMDAPASPADGKGAVGAVAMCLAILLMIVGLVVPRRRAWPSRAFAREQWISALALPNRSLRPPDLAQLSISRT